MGGCCCAAASDASPNPNAALFVATAATAQLSLPGISPAAQLGSVKALMRVTETQDVAAREAVAQVPGLLAALTNIIAGKGAAARDELVNVVRLNATWTVQNLADLGDVRKDVPHERFDCAHAVYAAPGLVDALLATATLPADTPAHLRANLELVDAAFCALRNMCGASLTVRRDLFLAGPNGLLGRIVGAAKLAMDSPHPEVLNHGVMLLYLLSREHRLLGELEMLVEQFGLVDFLLERATKPAIALLVDARSDRRAVEERMQRMEQARLATLVNLLKCEEGVDAVVNRPEALRFFLDMAMQAPARDTRELAQEATRLVEAEGPLNSMPVVPVRSKSGSIKVLSVIGAG